jgi:hypothetical protein
LASAITLFVFFLFWSVLLLIFKCCAPPDSSNATRWLSGGRLQIDEPPSEDRKPYQFSEWTKHYEAIKRQLYVFRGIVLFAGLSIVISAIVMSVGGTSALTQTLDSARLSIGLVHELATEAVSIVDRVIQLNQIVSSEIFTLLEDVNGMCPNVRDPLCDNLEDPSTCDISGFLGAEIDNIFKQVVGHFAAGERSVIYQEIIKARDGLSDVQEIALDMDHAAAQFNWAFIVSMVFSLLLAVLCLFIMSSLVFRMPKMMRCMKSRIMMPLFVVLVIFSYVFSLLFVTASIATADTCVYESPQQNVDQRILTLLERFQETLSPIVVEFARFYISQCPAELLPKELVEQKDYIIAGVPAIKEFSNIVRESTELIQGACGFTADKTQTLIDLADTAQEQLCAVADILKRVRLFFQCETWFPLYETTTYEALCYSGTNGFAYIASTQFVIVFMAFIIVTFRVAFWDVQIGDDPKEDEEEFEEVKKTHTEETDKEDGKSGMYYSGISVTLQSSSANLDRGKSFCNSNLDSRNEGDSGDASTQENTDDDGSGDLVLDHHHVNSPHGEDESENDGVGVEVGHFDNRADAWAVWARQFTVKPIGGGVRSRHITNHTSRQFGSDDGLVGDF